MSKTNEEMCRSLSEVREIKKALIPRYRVKRTTNYMRLLAHPTRLQILKLLSKKDLCVCVLSKVIGRTQPNISQHLGKLKDNQIIEGHRIGKLTFYKIRDKKIQKMIENI